MDNTIKENEYNKISPTAKITAYWRSLSDIPYSKEIADAMGAEQGAKQILGDRMTMMAHFSPPILESRYKAIDAGLRKYPVDNVLELACGLSPRGLGLAANNKKYIGTDLPDLLSESAPLITTIAAKLGITPGNLRFQPVNVLDKEQLEYAIRFFNGEKFGICNEGLLMYLNREEKATMAQNIRSLLLHSGGYWVTPDIMYNDIRKKLFASLKPEIKEKFTTVLGAISNQVGRDIAGNDFEAEAEAIKFYEEIGFNIEKFPFYDGSYKISTLSNLPQEMEESVLNVLSHVSAWILTPRH
jgi:hypothetical protein